MPAAVTNRPVRVSRRRPTSGCSRPRGACHGPTATRAVAQAARPASSAIASLSTTKERRRPAYPAMLASAHDDGVQEGRGVSDYLDPTDSVAVPRQTATRPPSLDGRGVSLLDIGKAKGEHLLDRLEELLRERARPRAIVRRKKPTFARPAPDRLREGIVGATDVLIEALAD